MHHYVCVLFFNHLVHFCSSSSYTCTFVLFILLIFFMFRVCFIYALINIFSSYIWNISHNFILVFIFLVNHPLLRNVTNPLIKNKATSSQEMPSVWCLWLISRSHFHFFQKLKNSFYMVVLHQQQFDDVLDCLLPRMKGRRRWSAWRNEWRKLSCLCIMSSCCSKRRLLNSKTRSVPFQFIGFH